MRMGRKPAGPRRPGAPGVERSFRQRGPLGRAGQLVGTGLLHRVGRPRRGNRLARIGLLGLAATALALGGACARPDAAGPRGLRLDDREAIRDTLHRYAIDLDDGRTEAFLELFTDDAVFTAADLVYTGRDAIRTELAEKPRGPGKHLPYPAVIEFEGPDTARAWSDFLRVKQDVPGDPESWRITSVGRYYDQLVRGRDGRWRFRRRDVQILELPNPNPLVEPARDAAPASIPQAR